MAASSTLKAWTGTSLLSMVRAGQVDRGIEAFATGSPVAVTELLCEIAGPSYDAYALETGMDATRAMKLGAIVMRLLCEGLHPAVGPVELSTSVQTLHHRAKRWIEFGSVPDARDDLQKISDLIGDSPPTRLALLAPFAPALSSCAIVFRAQNAAYPFFREQAHGSSSQQH
jgi:hypothetical protein